jgi:hypothetical protein
MKTSLSWKLAAAGLLFFLPLALRILPIRHGLPRNYVPDTHMVRQALAMARDHDLAPQAGKYSFYPNLLPYLLLPCYAAEYGIGKAGGSWSGAKGFGERLLDHPEDAELVARLLVAVFGALTPLVVYRTARAAGLGRGAWVSAWLAGTSLLAVQLSTHERPWAPMAFFMSLACWPAARYARDGRASNLVLSGAAAALAAASHQGGLAALGIPALAWLLGPLEWKRGDLLARLRQGTLCVAVFLAIALVAGYPHLLRYGFRDAKVAGGAAQVERMGGIHIAGLSIVFDVRWQSLVRLAKAVVGYDPAVVALGLGGLALGLARRELRAPLVFALVWAAFFMTNRSDHVRYLLPAVIFLCWPAGLLAEELLKRGWGRIALGIGMLAPLVQAVRLDWVLARPDARAEAEARLAALPAGAVVAVDRYGPEVDLDRRSLARLARLRASVGESLRAREERRKRRFEEGSMPAAEEGLDAVRIEELFEVGDRTGEVELRPGLEPLGQDPRQVLGTLGVTHFLAVERRPGGDPANALQTLARRGKAVFVVDPAAGLGPPAEAFLPTEMDFAMTALWQVSRPGPWMALYDLRSQ